ncbi:uncharacterized protein E0L32_004693 [Thyridium curvatum]|uniref:Protein transport protein sec73 n=1 Tax=Thyridium curvatum TaxID=1093900 RepID=A0A507AWH5_9PEZI|nr:uncharacterized protein E0L32_004693 [Thyridium curvatum]TPX15135.1 hypothetical protein E0L32_004693 [Thyridium curvatum]
MPFLRRRGVMASESDMRRHTLFPAAHSTSKQAPRADPVLAEDDPRADSLDEAPAPQVPAPPVTPPNDSPSSSHVAMSMDDPISRPESPPIQEETPKHRRFSMLRFRNASDSQLATRAKQLAQAEKPPPLPQRMFPVLWHNLYIPLTILTLSLAPEIITTAPTLDFMPQKKQSFLKLSTRMRKSGELPRDESEGYSSLRLSKKDRRRTLANQPGLFNGKQSVSFEEPDRGEHGEGSVPTLAVPNHRLSESSRSEASWGDHSTHSGLTSAASSFFRLPRRKQKHEPLFPISHLQKEKSIASADPAASTPSLAPESPHSVRASTSSRISGFGNHETPTQARPSTGKDRPHPSPARALFQKSNASPATALFRPSSRNSGTSSPTRAPPHLRGRSSTMSSLGRESLDDRLAPPTTRTSSSTGRKSFGDLLGLSRLRQNSDLGSGRHGSLTPATPGSNTSKNNSLQLPRDSVVLPERRDDDTPAKYLARLEEVISRSLIASVLSKATDTFSQSVLRSYMRTFSFFGDPMDMAIRKLLMEAELPKETQQIDRCLQSFANRYHECNPGIYSSPDQAYFIAFSLLILHTDVFNKNNKYKMQKADYLKNTRGEGIFDEILEVFYDNITYTPFIHVEDDIDITGERSGANKSKKKSIFQNGTPDVKKAAKEPIDPYTLIIDNKLDILRPNLKEVMYLDDPYGYLGTAKSLNLKELQKTFFRTGVLQIVSARSRPDAFMTEKTVTNPEEAHPGIVDIKVTKVGLLWRKDAKKKKTRSPWQEWGAVLTGAQLYFFRNTAWIKNLMHQYDQHIKHENDGVPVIFKPPLDNFKPDALMSTDGAVALMDSTYKKHKNAFLYVRHGGFEEVLLADNEEEMNDWLAKLNYAAAFRTSGVRMRGVVGGNYEGQNRRALRRLDADANTQSVQTPTGEVTITRSRIDQKMAQDILTARRDAMVQKVTEANEKLVQEEKKLEEQLRNARHLQILAPVQPKTREQMLLSAARMATQLKWTRMESWKIKCHRDILILDLEEEQQLMGLPPLNILGSTSPEKAPAMPRDDSKTSTIEQPAAQSPPSTALQRTSTAGAQSENDSPLSDVFQTPPTSATAQAFHRHKPSWESTSMGLPQESIRKSSVSSVVSSAGRSITATPPRKIASAGSASDKARLEKQRADDEEDADERDFLAQAGLLEASPSRRRVKKMSSSIIEDGDAPESHASGGSAEKLDRSKIRRSLQRTLREGAGHLSHHRSRRNRDSATAGASEESAPETSMLTRGSGSFVVHGKKASVINFGGDLHGGLSPDERLRQRKSQQGVPQAQDATATTATAASTSPALTESSTMGDFHAALKSHRDRPRRESAASASTATARSFQELHRKYSSAQQAAKAGSSSGGLVVPSDDDSDAAISFSDGRRTPLPPIEPAEEGELRLPTIIAERRLDDNDDEDTNDDDDDDDDNSSDDDSDDDFRSPLASAGLRAQFFTPEPPATPEPVTAKKVRDGDSDSDDGGADEDDPRADGAGRERGKQLANPPPQLAVS